MGNMIIKEKNRWEENGERGFGGRYLSKKVGKKKKIHLSTGKISKPRGAWGDHINRWAAGFNQY